MVSLVNEGYWNKIQHKFNPLDVHCRLREKGLSYEDAKEWAKLYEKIFFNVFFVNNGKRGLVTRLLGIKSYSHPGDSKFLNRYKCSS